MPLLVIGRLTILLIDYVGIDIPQRIGSWHDGFEPCFLLVSALQVHRKWR